MKHIPLITLLLWCVSIASYNYFQEIILRPEVKFPLLILLTVFITVSFWNLQKQGKRISSILFVALFFFNTGIIIYGVVHNHSILESMTRTSENQLDPNMARLLITADSEAEREMAARIIFERHGIALSYKVKDNVFKLYNPTKIDQDVFINNQDRNMQKKQFKENLASQSIPLLFLILLQVVIFLGLLIYLILSDKEASTDNGKVSQLGNS